MTSSEKNKENWEAIVPKLSLSILALPARVILGRE